MVFSHGGSLTDKDFVVQPALPDGGLHAAVGTGHPSRNCILGDKCIARVTERSTPILDSYTQYVPGSAPVNPTPISRPGPPRRNRLNEMDMAIAEALRSEVTIRPISSKILGIPGAPAGVERATKGMNVIKSGRTTYVTKGTVVATNITHRVDDYREPTPIISSQTGNLIGKTHYYAWFKNAIVIAHEQGYTEKFADEGDSGSVIINRNGKKVVGLLYSGASNNTNTINLSFATPIDTILGDYFLRVTTL